MRTLIIDYGMGNLLSVKRSFEKCGAKVFISENPADIKYADYLVLPGVGAFKDGMANLRSKEWIPAIREAVIEYEIPLLGICLGMQLLADKGYEIEETNGIGLIPGEVKRFEALSNNEKIPHVGWNEINVINDETLFNSIKDKTDFYFVHSYHFIPKNKDDVLSTTPYCGRFVSAIGRKNIFGVQFHPEKSQTPGFKLICNFLKQ